MSIGTLTAHTAAKALEISKVAAAIEKCIADKQYMDAKLVEKADRFIYFALSAFSLPSSCTKRSSGSSGYVDLNVPALCEIMGANQLLKAAEGHEIPRIYFNEYGLLTCTIKGKHSLFSLRSDELLQAYVFSALTHPVENLYAVQNASAEQIEAGWLAPNMFIKKVIGGKADEMKFEFHLGVFICFLLIDCIIQGFKQEPKNDPKHKIQEVTYEKYKKKFTNNGNKPLEGHSIMQAEISEEEMDAMKKKFKFVEGFYDGSEALDWFYYKTAGRTNQYAFSPSLGVYRFINIREYYNF